MARRAPAAAAAGGYKARARHRRQADRGAEEALRLRQAAARALRRDAEELRDASTSARASCSNKEVWPLIKEKLPVSISLGLWTFLLSYLISVPLGIAKAVREGSRFDALTTSRAGRLRDPGLRARRAADRAVRRRHVLRLFPLRGLTSDNWAELSWPARIRDYFWHLALPLTCFGRRQLRGRDDADQEHVRRGDPEAVRAGRARQGPVASARVLCKHIFRNALIPLVTGFRRRSSARSSPARC